MDTNQVEQYILLKQSGELPPDQLEELETVLAGNPEAQRFEDDLHRITQTTLLTPLPREVSPAMVRGIVQHADTFQPRRQAAPASGSSFFSLWNQALGYAAAAVALAIGTWFIIQRWQEPLATAHLTPPPAEDPILQDAALEAELQELSFMLYATQADWDRNNSETTGDDLDDIALALMQLEG